MTSNAERSIARARELARKQPASAELLTFYADLTEFMQTIAPDDPEVMVLPLLSWLQVHGTAPLARQAAELASHPSSFWRGAFDSYLAERDAPGGYDDRTLFVIETILQRSAVGHRALAREPLDRGTRRCPGCGGLPIVATLTERGHGALKSLVCGLCLTEWPTSRIECPACGETGFEALPVFRAEEFPGIRIDACQRCRTYIKTIDLTMSAVAIPVVDDLASLPMDLWAMEQGYRKLRPNLLRI